MAKARQARPEGGDGEMTMYRPTPEGGLQAALGERPDYRDDLRSRRWDAAPLANPEVEPTDPRIAVLFIAGLCALTLVLLVVGYASGFWR